jgi:predicted  nucleic acid-binding Zn-ribbon protein
MREPKPWVRLPCLAVVTIAAGCAPPEGSRLANDGVANSSIPPAPAPRIQGDESMAALTAEVRQLRVAVEELARSQAETQTLGMTLSAQQGRILQLTQQLDTARKEVVAAASGSEGLERQLAGFREEMSRVGEPGERAGFESAMRGLETERSRLELELQQARGRENDLSRQLALEERRWNDTLARMEQLTQ